MAYWMGALVFYVILQIIILRILRRSSILRDRTYVLDDASLTEDAALFLTKPKDFQIWKQIYLLKEHSHLQKPA